MHSTPQTQVVCVFACTSANVHSHLCVFNALEFIPEKRISGLHSKTFFIRKYVNKLENFHYLRCNLMLHPINLMELLFIFYYYVFLL